MNWFDTSGLTSLAKSALKEAQKTIDKALDIQDDSSEEQDEGSSSQTEQKSSPSRGTPQKDNSDFFASWGLTVSAESEKDESPTERPVVTESPSKSSTQTVWGSFAGSFFEQAKSDTIVKPPKAKSMNVISDAQFGSQDDLFSKSQLVMSDNEAFEYKTKKDEAPQVDERRGSSRSNILSLVSSRNSSDSVEVLSQSMKSTPDSEVSLHSMSQTSSISTKHNSESVEILPDSLMSPSSIECLGFDSYSSGKNSSTTSSNLSPGDMSDKKSTPIGDRTEKAETADSVSLVADDDDDTMSYNSISECTAPTVLDTDEKANVFPKLIKTEPRKGIERELMHLESTILPQKLQPCENSSNDGSWSDRTLNADNESITLDNTVDEDKKEREQEDALIDKLSDSSSFYNVNVSSDMLRSESSAFVNVEKQQCSSQSSNSSHKDSIKERTSPISSDSKSDLVKIGSDRTSGHTSGDEVETATSSDIEIIPSPNGDGFCRNSPAKYGFKNGKFDGSTSPNLVDLVLGKSLATKIRGHTRELSEASVQSNTSDESQGSENERLMRRLCEMAEILDARESRLMEVSRNNAELIESNAELKTQVESLMAKHELGDINTITEDYTQRMSALEKKFQQAIREKDMLRKQLDSLKAECSRKNSSELETMLKEKEEMVTQLQQEGEALARQHLHHSNIIKKLRAKDKDNEQVIKGLRDKISDQSSECERVKRALAAKEELEVAQIEAVYRLTAHNKKLETELIETKSALDDAIQRLESTRTSAEAARRELMDHQRVADQLRTLTEQHRALTERADRDQRDAELLRQQLAQLRTDMANEERRWVSRVEALRGEVCAARALALEAPPPAPPAAPPASVLAQLAHLQQAALHREHAHTKQIGELEKSLAVSNERERLSREECASLQRALTDARAHATDADARCEQLHATCDRLNQQLTDNMRETHRLSSELETLRNEKECEINALKQRVEELQQQLEVERNALDVERKRNTILQEQLSSRGDISPPQSVVSDSLSNSLWNTDDACGGSVSGGGGGGWAGGGGGGWAVEEALAAAGRREGELRAARAQRDQLQRERDQLANTLAQLQHTLDQQQSLQEQYDALLQMYGEKEEQLSEVRLDLQDVTALYKAQLDELVALKSARR